MRQPHPPLTRAVPTSLLALAPIGALLLICYGSLGLPFGHARLPRQRPPQGHAGDQVTGGPDWYAWALWLALRLRFVLRRGATERDREAAWRALDEFQAQVRLHQPRG